MRDSMFLNLPVLQVNLLSVETEMRITQRASHALQAKQATRYPSIQLVKTALEYVFTDPLKQFMKSPNVV